MNQLKSNPPMRHQKGVLGADVLDGRGHVVHALGGVHGLDKDGGGSHAQQVHGGAYQGLVSVEVDGGHGQEQGEDHAQSHRGQDDQEHHDQRRSVCGQKLHGQRTAQRTQHHDALQADVDDAGVFGEAPAQRHQQEDRGEDEGVLQ